MWKFLFASLLGPILIVGIVGMGLGQAEPWQPTAMVKNQEKALGKAPEVLVVGSSWAGSDIDKEELSSKLSLPESKVRTLSQSASQPCMWYAMLKYRAFERQLRPRLIVVVSNVPRLLDLVPVDMSKLVQHFPEPDAVLKRKVWGDRAPGTADRAWSRRAELRDGLLEWTRDLATGAFFSPGEGKSMATYRHEAGARVFGKVERGNAADAEGPTLRRGKPEESFIWDIAALARENGAKVVVLIPPVSPDAILVQHLDQAQENQMLSLAHENEVGWLDYRDFPVTRADFLPDGGHMRPVAATRFTTEVAEALLELGATEAGPLQLAPLPGNVQSAVRTGTMPVLDPEPRKLGDCQWLVDLSPWDKLGKIALAETWGDFPSPIRMRLQGQTFDSSLGKNAKLTDCNTDFVFRGKRSVFRLPSGTDPATVSFEFDKAIPAPDEPLLIYPETGVEWTLQNLKTGVLQVHLESLPLYGNGPPPTILLDGQPLSSTPVSEGPHRLALQLAPGTDTTWIRSLKVEVEGQITSLVVAPRQNAVDLEFSDLKSSSSPSGIPEDRRELDPKGRPTPRRWLFAGETMRFSALPKPKHGGFHAVNRLRLGGEFSEGDGASAQGSVTVTFEGAVIGKIAFKGSELGSGVEIPLSTMIVPRRDRVEVELHLDEDAPSLLFTLTGIML